MEETKRERYIRLLETRINDSEVDSVELTRNATKEVIELLKETDVCTTKPDFAWTFVADDVPKNNSWHMTIVWDTFTGIHPCPAFYTADSNVWNRANVILWHPHSEPSQEEIEKWWDGSELEKDLRKMLGYGY